jgi:class 3 adenylate cyclase
MEREEALAILFSDIRGFTSYTAERGDREAYRLAKTFVGLVEEQVDRHTGQVVKTYGDGVLTAFPAAEQGIRCAAAMQEALSEHNQGHPDETISAGIGGTWGEVIQAEGDLFGNAVNLAARLADYAKGGQVIVSSEVKRLAGGFRYLDLGNRELQGLGEQRLYELIWRSELARLSTKDDRLNLVLTEDNRFVIELSKGVQAELQQVRERLQEKAEKQSGLAKLILGRVERYLAESLPKIIDKALTKAGVGLEHTLDQVEAAFEGDELVLKIEGHRGIRLGKKEIDLPEANEFLARLKALKSVGPSE